MTTVPSNYCLKRSDIIYYLFIFIIYYLLKYNVHVYSFQWALLIYDSLHGFSHSVLNEDIDMGSVILSLMRTLTVLMY